MKLVEVKVQNFRSYRDEITMGVDDLTILIGKNDAGKSTLLDALDVFFNDAILEKEDACVDGNPRDVRITCVFNDLPQELVLDEQHPTSLQNEYLTRQDGCLEVCRVFSCTAAKGKQTGIFARAHHPSADNVHDLLSLKIRDLRARATELDVDLTAANQTVKTAIRRAIWGHVEDLALTEIEVPLSSDTGKDIWERLQAHLPVYALFKSDRASTDQDEEAQDPMKAAIREVVKNHETQLNRLVDEVQSELQRVAQATVEKIQEMNPELANTLDPNIKTKKWDTLFSVSLTGDEGISMNKRGSGTRRLVLLNFLRAKAEETAESRNTGAIYAIEEPETSQHPNHQVMLIEALQDLADSGRAQILLTTHTPTLARKADRSSLRFITKVDGAPAILHGDQEVTLKGIKATLGVLPDHDVKVFIGVEGKWDIQFLKRISAVLHQVDETLPDLNVCDDEGAVVFIPLGGSSMELWTSRLAGFDRPEIYFTDRDEEPPANPKYHAYLTEWQGRDNCSGYCTQKREMENYLHPSTIQALAPTFPDTIADFDDVPEMLAKALHEAEPGACPWDQVEGDKLKKKCSRAKKRLNQECVDSMTMELLAESDPNGEIISWIRQIAGHLDG